MSRTSAATLVDNARDASHDFDFYMGRWHIDGKRLLAPLCGSDSWEHFEAEVEACPLPGGIGNYDHLIGEQWRPGFVGLTIRIFSPLTQKWSIYWLDNKTGGLDNKGQLGVPVVGGFKDGVGIFTCDDTFDGKAIVVRYRWSEITARSLLWEQAFSSDGGATWETDWVMRQTRIQA